MFEVCFSTIHGVNESYIIVRQSWNATAIHIVQGRFQAFPEIEAEGSWSVQIAAGARATEIYAPALIRQRVFWCIVIANADCACSIGRGLDLYSKEPALPM